MTLPTKQNPHPFRVAAAMAASMTMTFTAMTFHVSGAEARSVLERAENQSVYEGFTEPEHQIFIAANEIGVLESVEVEVGDRVRAGQVIATVDDDLQASAVEIATYQATMTGERDATRAEVELTESRAESLRNLFQTGMARPDELARAETDFRIAMARYAAAEEQLQLRQLELRRYQIQLDRRKVRSPMDGVIAKVVRKPGEYLSPGEPSVAELLVVGRIIAVFNIPVEETASIQAGAPVRIFLRSTSMSIQSTIASIAPAINGESGTVQVRVVLDNVDGRLLAGDRCTLKFLPPGSSTVARKRNSGEVQR
jgi:RND family efflux transporter MFP subunit